MKKIMAKENISIKEMLNLSKELKARHPEWGKVTPDSNIYWLGWLVGEIGEVIDIVKKKGVEKIMRDPETRKEMIEELADCYMFLADILNRYKFSHADFSKTYFKKMDYNFKRDYKNSKTKADKKKEAERK